MNRAKIKAANIALFTDRRLSAVAELFSADYTVHLTEGVRTGGHEMVRQFLSAIFRAFPALQVEVEILAEQSDRIVWQRTLRGVQQAAFQGFPGCGREIVWRDMITSRFCDGLIAEEWVVSDLAERLLRARKKGANA